MKTLSRRAALSVAAFVVLLGAGVMWLCLAWSQRPVKPTFLITDPDRPEEVVAVYVDEELLEKHGLSASQFQAILEALADAVADAIFGALPGPSSDAPDTEADRRRGPLGEAQDRTPRIDQEALDEILGACRFETWRLLPDGSHEVVKDDPPEKKAPESAPAFVELPGPTLIAVSHVLYSRDKPTENNFFGDGFSAFVGIAPPSAVRGFVTGHVKQGSQWIRGPMRKVDMPVVEFLERWMEANKAREEISRVADLEALFSSKSIYYWRKILRNSSGDISNALLWIIDTERNLIVKVNMDT